jgi:uncharacterized protein (DUF362 family)
MITKLFVDSLDRGYLSAIRGGLAHIGLGSTLRPGDSVFVKPNLTFPVFRRGVMTNTECVEALVVALKDYTDRIVVGEADSGGYNRFDIDDVMYKTGLKAMEKQYGIRAVNLSHLERRPITFAHHGRKVEVPLPTLLLDETDLFITVPVPKVHMNTHVSVAIKNQWGCIPEPALRLRLHPLFNKVIYEVNKAIRTSVAVVDGRYGLNRCGPMLGDPVELGWLMVSNDIVTNDLAACRLMRVDARRVEHLMYFARQDRRPAKFDDVVFNTDLSRFIGPQFYLKKKWTDRLSSLAFRSEAISYLAYRSPLSDVLHRLLYLARKPFYNYQDPSLTTDGAAPFGSAEIAPSSKARFAQQ